MRLFSAERYRQAWDNRGPDRARALYEGFPDLITVSFAKVLMPVLLVAGAQSPPLFRLLIEELAKRLPNARKAIIPDASHIVHADAPLAPNGAVLKFLDAVG